MDYFNSLPEEITLEILTRLPTESALGCKLVCKNWRSIVSHHPLFSKIHLDHLNDASVANDGFGKLGSIALTIGGKFHYYEYDENHGPTRKPIQRIRKMNFTSPLRFPRFTGSCNGLICLAQDGSISICNPITREYVIVPLIDSVCGLDEYGTWMNGFGYVSSTNEYKVVRINVLKTFVEVYIYTLGSGINRGWRNLGKFNFQFNPLSWYEDGIYGDGALYWLDTSLKIIIPFDLAEEQFSEHISPPSLPPQCSWYNTKIRVLDGFVYLIVYTWRTKDIWLLKKKNQNHGMKEGEEHQSSFWTKEFSTDMSRLFAVTKSDCVLNYSGYYLNIYDTKTSTSKRLVKFKYRLLEVSLHQNTLVSLKELGEEDTRTLEPVEISETRSRDYSFQQL